MDTHRPEYARIRIALCASTIFGDLPASTLDALADAARLERYERGGCVDCDDKKDVLWLVLEGGLVVYWVNSNGESIPISTIGRGSFYNTTSLVEGAKRATECRAERGTALAAVPGQVIRELATHDAALAQSLTRILLQRFQASLSFYADAIGAPLPVRLARRVLGQALAVRHDPRKEVELSVSQASLARVLGASRSKLNTELRRLEDEGVLRLGYGKIYVRDVDKLGEIAGGPVFVF